MRSFTGDKRPNANHRGQLLAIFTAPLLILAAACNPESASSEPPGEGTAPSGLSATGIVAAYAFDEGAGMAAADASGNGNGATLLNGAGWVTGHSGSAVNLDGTNDTVSAGNVAALNGLRALTVSAWIKGAVGTGSADGVIVGKDGAFALVVGMTPHKLGLALKSGNTWFGFPASTTSVDDGKYHFVTGTYDGATMKVYVDGAQQGSQSIGAHVLNSPSTALLIGSCLGTPDCDASGEMWRGAVDDVRVYNRALSLTEIQTDRDNPVTPAAPDTTPPSVPTNLGGVAVSSTQVNLSWTASTDNVGVTGYRIFRNGTQVGTSTTTSFSDVGLTPSTMYSYTVAATDAAMNASAPSSPPVTVTTLAQPDTTPPSAPTGVTGTAASVSCINLTWTASMDNVGVTGYRIFRNGTQVGTSTTTSFSDVGLTPSTMYSYTVAATDAAMNVSAQSSPSTVTTLADTTPPSTPTNLAGTASSSSQINLSWTAATDDVGVTGYQVFRNGSLVGTPTAPSFSDTGLSASTSYSYTVAAVDAASNVSTASAPITVTTQASGAAGQVPLASDDFNRPDGALGPNWTVIDSNPVIHNQHIEETNASDGWDSIAIYTAKTWPDNQYSQVRVLAANQHGGAAPIVRALNTTVIEMYTLFVTGPLGTGAKLTLAKFITHIYTEIWSANVTVNAGDMLYLSANGSTLTVKLNGNTVTTQVDTSLTHGYAGFDLTNYVENPNGAMGDGQLDDWEAGAIGGVPPPTNLMGTASSSTQIDLSWAAPAGASGIAGYDVFRNGTLVGTPSATTYSDSGLSLGTKYTYTVAAFDGLGNTSPASSPISVTTLGDTTPPSVPTNLAGAANASNQINLTWSASTDDVGVASYDVFRDGAQVGTSTTPSFTDSTIVASTTYSYTVRAVDFSSNKSAFSAPVNVTTNAVPPASPVVAFDFNEGMGTTASDSSGNNNLGTLINGPTWTSGHTSFGVLLDGTNDYVSAGNIAALNGLRALTVSAWVKGTVGAASPDGILIGKDAAFSLGVGFDHPHKAQLAIKSGSTWFGFPASTTSVDDGAFHYVTGVYNGSAMQVYVDGRLEGSRNVGALTLGSPSSVLQIGSCLGGPNCDGSGEMWQGTVDDVRVYNVALTGAQILTDMNTPVP